MMMSEHRFWIEPDMTINEALLPPSTDSIECLGQKIPAGDVPQWVSAAKNTRHGWPFGENRGFLARLLRREPEWLLAPDCRGKIIK